MKINDRKRELFPGEAYFFPKFQNRADRQIFLGMHISSPNLKTGKANSHFWGSTFLPIISNQGRQTHISGHNSSPNSKTGMANSHFWGSIFLPQIQKQGRQVNISGEAYFFPKFKNRADKISSPDLKTRKANSHF